MLESNLSADIGDRCSAGQGHFGSAQTPLNRYIGRKAINSFVRLP